MFDSLTRNSDSNLSELTSLEDSKDRIVERSAAPWPSEGAELDSRVINRCCAACNSSSKNQVYFLCDECKTACESSEWLPDQVALFRNRIDEIGKEQSPDLGGMDFESMSDGEDLTCPKCSSVFTKVWDFQQHFKQFHPQEKVRSLREKAKFVQK